MPAPSTLLLKLALRLLSSLKIPVDRRRIRERGFVLPVAILIVLVLSLVTVGLLTRSTQRNIQTQVERAGQTVSRQLNAAIDRARAKIDYLIRDPRLPAGTPTDAQLVAALINDGAGDLIPRDENDPYILPDETQFVITTNIEVEDPNNPGQTLPVPVRAPAWWFLVDSDGNGVNDSVTAYTILNTRRAADADFEDSRLTDTERARRLMIRSGPLQGSALGSCNDNPAQQTINPNVGDWFQVGSALYKPFQVFAVTLPIQGADSTTRAISALQFQQDRKRDLLNKWGAFSRGDVEFFFTPPYNWNGAIYAGGSLFFRYAPGNVFRAFTVSSEQSCFYMPVDNSEITAFGELVAGAIGYAGQQVSDSLTFDVHPGQQDVAPRVLAQLNNLNFDSVQNGVEPESVALDPLELHLFGRIRPRGNYQQDAAGWAASPLNAKQGGRIKAGGFQSDKDQVCPPYVDDVYRADNRFGPKASYERPPVTPDPQKGCNVPTFAEKFSARAGDSIPADAKNELGESLTADKPPPGALSEVGLDGYWERRARVEGLRVIVGQRLELTRTDSLPLPLVPGGDPNDPNDPTKLQAIFISNEARQRLTLRDNPAAVQATAVYHYSHENGRFPIACLATVAHPGTPWSLQRASTFPDGNQQNQLGINFFTGQGTNVWEYDPAPMKENLRPGTPLWTALTNLANFAGDPDGAYPPKQEPGRIHPDPFITAFGNFSELRRVIDTVNGGTSVDQLSLADQTTLQTAGCMLGMLADNILRIRDAAKASNPDPQAGILWKDIQASRKGELDNPERNRFYLPLRYIFPDTTKNNTNFFDGSDPIERERQRAYRWLQPATYQALCDPRNAGCNLGNLDDLELIRLQPRPTIGDWRLPRATATCPSSTLLGGNHPNSNQMELIQVGNQCHRVPFKDSVFYDGREAMAVRALNIDLALLTNNVNGQANGLINGDTWLPAGVQEGREGGIFYAFREDAVREDAIARPPLTNFAAYQTAWQAANARGTLPFIMNAGQPGRDQPVGDPPVSAQGLSPKPVDYYPDPDRRPYGFRLRNGAVLARGGFNLDEAVFGLSFISDNPVYIQGDFNLHQTRGGDRLEEFRTLLNFGSDGLYSNFYGRLRRDEDRRFARAAQDLWRPSEIIGDSVNILSADFCDGSIDDGFVQDGTLNGGGSSFVANRIYQGSPQRASAPRRNEYYGCSGPNLGANTSFLNQALVIRGNNWPAPDPNRDGAGVLRFDNTGGAQNLGDHLRKPGWPDVFARDTIFAPFDENNDQTRGKGVPTVRQLRAPDKDYADFGVRISALGNPVLDTSRWLLVAPLQRCPIPQGGGGGGLLAEYYNGWLSSPQNQYDRNTGFAQNGTVGPLPSNAQSRNLPYLRAVRWPDPIYPMQDWQIGTYMKETDQGGPTCDPSDNDSRNPNTPAGNRWACIRDALQVDSDSSPSRLTGWDPGPFARWTDGGNWPWWGGFYYLFANQNYLNTNSPFLWPFSWNDWPSYNERPNTPKADFLWMPRCKELDQQSWALIDAEDIGDPNSPIGFLRSCWRRRSGGSGSGNNNGNDFFVVRWVGQLYPMWPGQVTYNLNTDDGGRIIIRRNPDYQLAQGQPEPFLRGFYLDKGSRIEGSNYFGAESWQDSANAQITFRLEMECVQPDPEGDSPYLVEIQAYENAGNAFVRFSTQADEQLLENYDLRYLKPLKPVNLPCEPDPIKGSQLDQNQNPVQRSCAVSLNCDPIWTDWTPACRPDICQPTTITQTKTATLPAGCPGTPPTPQTRQHTCNPQYRYGDWSAWSPQCTQQQQCSRATITQTRTRTVTPLCTSQAPFTETQTQTITCQPPGAQCTYTDWTPACTLANGGLTITQTRTETCNSICGTTTRQETQTVTCPQTCNYNWGPWSPASCDEVINQIACGTTRTFTQTRTGTLIPSTSSPTCQQTKTETRNLTCQGRPCGPGTFAPDAPGKSPLGEWMAAKPNTVDLRPVWEIEADPEPETISVHDVAQAADEGVTIALEPRLSPVLEVKAGVPKPPKLPSPAEALQAAFNWIFGEPAHAARQGLVRGNVLSERVVAPNREPGIQPAISDSPLSPLPDNPPPAAQLEHTAKELRRKLLVPSVDPSQLKIHCSEDLRRKDGKEEFWVPGVFRPNFNDRFRYEAYTGASRPSTLRFKDKNGNGQPDPDEVLDRDPLFGFDSDPNRQGLEIQPQMALNPYAWVRDDDTQDYNNNKTYQNGYYIDHKGNEDIGNGLCFYVRFDPTTKAVQVQIDRNGATINDSDFPSSQGGVSAAFAWVNVEPFTLDLNKPATGFAGDNPVLGVILDEVTRRPIPIPRFQELASTNVSQRRRNDDGSQNRQLQPARETRVNAVAVSGVLPSRLHQTAGGMHNFLRLNELWRNTDLFFSGSMIQLNYSTYATGPFLQRSFEPPNLVPDPTFVLGYDYYFPPRRRFGYDVGLQIARRPGAVSRRFQFPSNARTEFLRELDPQDPYVRRLRCALQNQPDVPLDPSAQIGGCSEFN